MVPNMSMVFMGISLAAGILLPLALLLIFRKRFNSPVKNFFIGCAVFILFALGLENILHAIVLTGSLGERVMSNTPLYIIYGSLAAGIFEELGRFTAFKTVMRKSERIEDSLMYGAGHGGVEVLLLLGLSMVNNLIYAVLINTGNYDMLYAGIVSAGDAAQGAAAQLDTVKDALISTEPYNFLVAIVERIGAVTVHIALSVLVYAASRDRKRLWLLPVSIVLHALVNGIAVTLSQLGVGVWVIEGVVLAFAALVACFARVVYRAEKAKINE